MTRRRRLTDSLLAASLLAACALPACDKSEPAAPPAPASSKPEKAPEKPARPAPTAAKADAGVGDDDGLGRGTDAQQQILVRAKAAFLNNRWEEAEQHFRKLVETGPVSGPQVTAYIALGDIYKESGREKEALALYEELLAKAPDVAEVQFVVARTLAEQGESTRAMRAYEKTLELDPNFLQALVELAGLYVKAGRKEEGEKLFYNYEKKIYGLSQKVEDPKEAPEEKLRVLEIFSFMNDDRANQAIVAALDDPHPAVREKAINLAEELRLGAAAAKLELMASGDPDPRVRLTAESAARNLADAPQEGASPVFKTP